MATGGKSLSGFPVLDINSGINVSDSYKAWLEEFTLAIEFRALDMGTEQVTDPEDETRKVTRDKFTDKAKTIILLDVLVRMVGVY